MGSSKVQQHEGGRVGHDHQRFGISRGIRPGTAAVPATALVSDMGEGSLLLEGWRDGPSAYLRPAGSAPLRRELAKAVDSTDLTPSNRQGEAP